MHPILPLPCLARPGLGMSGMLMVSLLLGPGAVAGEVLIVTDSHHPVQTVPGARVILLDLPERIELQLSAGLPVDAGVAEVFARQRLQDQGGNSLRRLSKAYQDVADAWGLGITQVPAVVVDGCYVVYGEPDAARAVERIQAYQRARP